MEKLDHFTDNQTKKRMKRRGNKPFYTAMG